MFINQSINVVHTIPSLKTFILKIESEKILILRTFKGHIDDISNLFLNNTATELVE